MYDSMMVANISLYRFHVLLIYCYCMVFVIYVLHMCVYKFMIYNCIKVFK